MIGILGAERRDPTDRVFPENENKRSGIRPMMVTKKI